MVSKIILLIYVKMLMKVSFMNSMVDVIIMKQFLCVLYLLVCNWLRIVGMLSIRRILVVLDLIIFFKVKSGVWLFIVLIVIKSLGVEVLKVMMVRLIIKVGILSCRLMFIVLCISVLFVSNKIISFKVVVSYMSMCFSFFCFGKCRGFC